METAERASSASLERAVRMFLDHQTEYSSWRAEMIWISAKAGCTTKPLSRWVRQAEREQGLRAGPASQEHESIKALERENRELRRANEIFRKASSYFAQAELDRLFKP